MSKTKADIFARSSIIAEGASMPRVLVVDDESNLVSYLTDQLMSQGYEVSGAYDGVEAVLKVAESDWDVLLIDIRMPKLDGIGALRIIRRIKPDIPVIMFTDSQTRVKCCYLPAWELILVCLNRSTWKLFSKL